MELSVELYNLMVDNIKTNADFITFLINRMRLTYKWLSEERAELNYKTAHPDRPWTALGEERKKWIDDAELELREEGKL